jgi:hypothetical protein
MITFSVTAETILPPEQICDGMFDVEKWSSFTGYGPLPGIRQVTMLSPENSRVGTEFHVENTDGSRHKETVLSFDPGRCIVMKMADFSPPLRHLATHFIERWDFAALHPEYRITRTFELFPKNALAAVPLWLIARLLKKAVARHTHQLANPKQG